MQTLSTAASCLVGSMLIFDPVFHMKFHYVLVRINSPAFIRCKTYIVAATLQLFIAYSSRLLLQILLP